MNKITALFLLVSTFCFAQLELRNNPYLKGEIILIDGDVKNGFIKLNGSAFSVEFKESEDQRKAEKMDYKNIDRIVLNSQSSGRREFYYKKTDADKFYKFVELIYSNNLEVYVYSPDNLSLFYSSVDRSNIMDFLNSKRWGSTLEIKENLAKAKSIKYLLHKKDSEKLNFIYSNKKLSEYAVENFSDCPRLISKIENKELILENIFEIVDLYNNCKIE